MLFEKHIETLFKISKIITSDFYLDDILYLIVKVVAEVWNLSICSLMLIDENKNELIVRASHNNSELHNKKLSITISDDFFTKVILNNKPIVVSDVTKEREYNYKEIAKKEGLCSLLCVPISIKGKVMGVISCYTSKQYNFSEQEIEFLLAIANQTAIVIYSKELLIKNRILEQEIETRKKIERAKGILMREKGLSEEEAYIKIRKFSMNNRLTMREVAESIILKSNIDI